MTTRQMRWILQEHEDKTFDVLRSGRRVRNHLPREVAMEHIKKNKGQGDIIFHEAIDGYRTKLSGGRSGRKKS
jgi:hypothetical protein